MEELRHIKLLKSKERKEIVDFLNEYYGVRKNYFDDKAFLYSDAKKEKIWLCSKEIADMDFKDIKVDSIGMLFLRMGKIPKITSNAVQLLRNEITKNIVELNDYEARMIIRGLDIDKELDKNITTSTVVLKREADYIGVGLYKDGKIKSLIPKSRRIKKLDV